MMRQLLADFKFQLTTSQGGRQNIHFRSVLLMTFQLTTSRGGRPGKKTQHNPYNCISTHDLTKRSTEYYKSTSATELFQLTTSQGGRPFMPVIIASRHLHFNSRPHEEVDVVSKVLDATCSSFQLTTSRGGRPIRTTDFSQILPFQLTRRSTRFCHVRPLQASYFNSRPHEEVDVKMQQKLIL